jgi:hypothetical protein
MTYVLVIVECLHLWDRSEGFQLQPQQADVVHWRWTAAIARDWAYQLLHHGRCPFCGADLIWKSGAPLRVKIFLWLACRRRIWTADRRRWRGLDAHDACWLCDQQPETADHLLVVCPVAKEAYWRVLSWAICVCTFGGEETVQEWWEHLARNASTSEEERSRHTVHDHRLTPMERAKC